MENNLIQMAGHAVANTIGPIFKHIIDYVQLYLIFKASIDSGLWA